VLFYNRWRWVYKGKMAPIGKPGLIRRGGKEGEVTPREREDKWELTMPPVSKEDRRRLKALGVNSRDQWDTIELELEEQGRLG
jgi:hypothetical protein